MEIFICIYLVSVLLLALIGYLVLKHSRITFTFGDGVKFIIATILPGVNMIFAGLIICIYISDLEIWNKEIKL